MKRRLLSQVLHRQDVCLLCTYHLRNAPALRMTDRFPRCRNFLTTSPTSQRAAEQVKEEEEDDDSDFSMLKQNAALSFPSRSKPTGTSVQSSPERPFSQRGLAPQESRFSQTYRTSESAQRPLIKYHVIGQNDQQSHYESKLNQDQPGGQSQSRQTKGQGASDANRYNRTASQPVRRHDRPPVGTRQPPGSFGEKGSSTYTFRPQTLVDDNSQGGGALHNSTGRHRISRHPQDDRARSDLPLRIRKLEMGSSTDNRAPQETSMQDSRPGSRRTGPNQSSHDKRGTAEAKLPDLASDEGRVSEVAGTFDAPAGSSFNTLDGSHHRRPPKSDRRAHRFDRYDNGGTDSAPTVPSNRSKARGRGFDFDAYEAEGLLSGKGEGRKKKKKQQTETPIPSRPTLQLPEFIGVERLAQLMKVNIDAFIEKLEEEGFEGARYDHVLDSSTSAMLADLYGFEPLVAGTGSTTDLVARPPPEDVSVLPTRPPIVTIMGHVDHGKTTILDFFRKSSVVASEHGGITQHIGAFSVVMPSTNRQITFLDTPGHAAFLEMRRRGANVTDIVVLVVAADDSVKPQTIEAIKHALEANVQIIVAINKIDKPDADIERVKQDLTRQDIVVEDYGGDYQVIPVSGKTGKGMSDLEEAIITLSDVNDYRAEMDGPAEGWVIESKVTTAGRVATVLVRRGTLRPGDCIVAGTTWARVRTLRNDAGALVDAAPPGTPVQVDGWRGADPTAGLEVLQADSEDIAKDVVDLRLEQEENMKTAANMAAINTARSEEADARAKVLAWEREQAWAKKSYGLRPKDNEGWVEADESTGPKKVHFVVKADVAGSVEALVAAVSAIGNSEISTNVIHSGTGSLTESDIRMLATTGEQCYAISFNQSVDGSVARLAEAAGLSVLDHNIIYKVTDNVKAILAEHLPPIITQRVLGEAEVGQVFEVTIKRRKVKIAGCRVTNGTISRSQKVRVQRGSEVVYTGTIDSLKNVKKDVTEMRKGTECGIGFDEWDNFQEGDQVQCFEEHHEKRTLY